MNRFLRLLCLLTLGLALTFPIAETVFAEEEALAQETTEVQEVSGLAKVNKTLFEFLFFDVSSGAFTLNEVNRDGEAVVDDDGNQKIKTVEIPFLIALLLFGAVFFSFFYRFVNIRLFKHAIDVVRGKYDKHEDTGEVSHFRALTSALSATVGLGNIAGVAIAIQLGGPGAVFWMMVTAVFGMASKFSSCTLSQMYRKVNRDGSISGGPMYYLDIGLREVSPMLAPIGKILGLGYALMIMGGAIGGGNMFQANQTAEAITGTFGLSEDAKLYIGLVLAVLVAIVILGGIKRIGAATSKIVPLMCGIYVLASLVVLAVNLSLIPQALNTIFTMAFTENAFFGGMVGVLVKGVQRAAFSNEAGLGSAAIAHAAAKTEEPVREGIVAMLGPFIDTIVICLMTSLVVIITGAWSNPELVAQGTNVGVSITSYAFETVMPWFPYVLTTCIALFAYSTMISWCYYGERGWIYIFDHIGGIGLKSVFIFRVVFVAAVVYGAVNKLGDVLDFSDAMILSIALPNIVGSIILAPKVLAKLKDYTSRLKSGEIKPTN